MNPSQPSGLCPSCDAQGVVGEPCAEKVCAKRGYRFLPPDYHAKVAAASAGTQDPVVGQLIDDYLVVDVLGAGGFGTVYLALQQPIQLRAALKLMNLRADPTLAEIMIEKFRAEAAALASLSHPNVVRLLKYGRFGDMPYLVMEFVEGARTLKDEIAARAVAGGTLHINETARIVTQCLNALEAAHERSIVHRDIKPDNIMLQKVSGDPHFVRVLDFGLAKFVDQRTLTSTTVGTPVYMAPEQLTKGRIGPWTDLYALGIVAFEMLTGLSPFPGDSQQAILTKKVDPSYSPTTRLSERDMPAYVVRFFQKAIARDPSERFQNAAEFRAEFQELHAAMGGDSGISTVTDVSEIVDEVAMLRAQRAGASRGAVGGVSVGGASGLGLSATAAGATPLGLASASTGLSNGPAWVHDDTMAQAGSALASASAQSRPTQAPVGAKKRSPWPFVGVGVAVALAASALLVLLTTGDTERAENRSDTTLSAVQSGAARTSNGASIGASKPAPQRPVANTPEPKKAPAPSLAPAEAKAMKLKTLMLVAQEHLKRRRWQDALTAFGEARVREPDNAEAKAGFERASAEKSRMTAVAKVTAAVERGDVVGAETLLSGLGDMDKSVYAPDVAKLTEQLQALKAAADAKGAKALSGTPFARPKPSGTAPNGTAGSSNVTYGAAPSTSAKAPTPPETPPTAGTVPTAENPGNAPSPAPSAKPATKPKATASKSKATKKTQPKPKAVADKPAAQPKPTAEPTPTTEPKPKAKPGTHVKIDKLDRASRRMKGRLKRLAECKPPKVKCPSIRNACVPVATCKKMTRLKRNRP